MPILPNNDLVPSANKPLPEQRWPRSRLKLVEYISDKCFEPDEKHLCCHCIYGVKFVSYQTSGLITIKNKAYVPRSLFTRHCLYNISAYAQLGLTFSCPLALLPSPVQPTTPVVTPSQLASGPDWPTPSRALRCKQIKYKWLILLTTGK